MNPGGPVVVDGTCVVVSSHCSGKKERACAVRTCKILYIAW